MFFNFDIDIRNIRRKTEACCSSDQKIQQNGARALSFTQKLVWSSHPSL